MNREPVLCAHLKKAERSVYFSPLHAKRSLGSSRQPHEAVSQWELGERK